MAKILVAEDEPDIRELLAFTLKYGGFDVVTAANGLEAVEQAQKNKPDMILLDVRMPRMTGYEACKVLKEKPETASIPIVFLSAKGQEAEVERGIEAGAVDYILKPFAPDTLISQIKKLLDKAGSKDGSPESARKARAAKTEKAEKTEKPEKTAKIETAAKTETSEKKDNHQK
jgi:two-component system alkaline phosphatase synthesis response regulator PhoP